jgi:hypothetical protein
LVIPTELSFGVVGRDGPNEVVALYARVLVPGATLDWSTRGEPVGDPGALDPSGGKVIRADTTVMVQIEGKESRAKRTFH